MVVQCTNCKSRFRVADEKVPDKGVKVRCTKCSTVFKVTRADAVDTSVKASPSRDPFGLDPAGTPLPARPSPVEDTSVDDPFAAALSPPPNAGNRVVPAVPPAVSLTYGAASPHQSLDLDLSLGPPSASVSPMPRPGMQGLTSSVAPPARHPSPPPFPPDRAANALDAAIGQVSLGDPFADLGLTAPPPAPPPPLRPPPPPSVDPFAVMHRPPEPEAADPFAIDVGGPPASPPQSPFIPPQFAQPPQHQPPPFAQPPQHQPPPGDPWVALLQNQPRREETDPFAGLDSAPSAPPPAPPPSVPPAQSHGPSSDPMVQAPAAPERSLSPRTDDGAGLGLRAGGNEFEIGEATRGHKLDIDYDKLGFETGPSPVTEARRDAVELGRMTVAKPPKPPVAPQPEERTRPADAKAAVRARSRKELASSIFNVLSVCVVLYAVIVGVAWFRAPRPIGVGDLGFPVVWLALGAAGSDPGDLLRASQIHSGIYPTNAGGELFYVEGVATNGTDSSLDGMYARVEIIRGGHVVNQADSLALQPTPPDSAEDLWPEQLWKLDSRKNDDLQSALRKDTSREVGAHQSAPFIAVFRLTAKDVEGCDLHVTVHKGIPSGLRADAAPAATAAPGATPAVEPSKASAASTPAASSPPTETADARPKLP